MYNFLRLNSLLPTVGMLSMAIKIFFLIHAKVVLEDLADMQPEYDVLRK